VRANPFSLWRLQALPLSLLIREYAEAARQRMDRELGRAKVMSARERAMWKRWAGSAKAFQT